MFQVFIYFSISTFIDITTGNSVIFFPESEQLGKSENLQHSGKLNMYVYKS